ncbi:hypothetical protein DYB26_002907 [Aphanomyces astaci]|uniref:AGC-kinase C-terminal domain-containing protein n=1 Tax=Aphanomyces astaci TaxID=112090 RepID=A0A418ENM3_APHAT|nr:hypothetical protein DYB26_002907 [Aphanomyces astaci]
MSDEGKVVVPAYGALPLESSGASKLKLRSQSNRELAQSARGARRNTSLSVSTGGFVQHSGHGVRTSALTNNLVGMAQSAPGKKKVRGNSLFDGLSMSSSASSRRRTSRGLAQTTTSSLESFQSTLGNRMVTALTPRTGYACATCGTSLVVTWPEAAAGEDSAAAAAARLLHLDVVPPPARTAKHNDNNEEGAEDDDVAKKNAVLVREHVWENQYFSVSEAKWSRDFVDLVGMSPYSSDDMEPLQSLPEPWTIGQTSSWVDDWTPVASHEEDPGGWQYAVSFHALSHSTPMDEPLVATTENSVTRRARRRQLVRHRTIDPTENGWMGELKHRRYAVDWWSLGALAYEMLIGHPPFETKTKNRKELHKKILTAKLVLPKWLSSDAHSLLKSLLERNVDKRLGGGKSSMFVVRGVQALKCHPFFRTIDWIAMAQMRIPPPMVPRVTHAADTQNFDTEFTELPPTDLACGDFDGDNETFRGFSFCGRHELLEVVDDVESLVLHRTRAMSRRASKELLEYILTARLFSISQIVRASVMTRHMSQQNMLFVFCAFNVIFWFGLYAYFQEKLTIHGDAPPELVVMCPQYFIYTVVAYCGSCFKRGNTKKEKSSTSEEPQGFVARQPPWHVFVCIAAATFGSYYFSFRALRHVSYLLKVLGKTCKPIPILVLGLCFGKTYPPRKYASVLLITSGAAVFFLFQAKPPSSQVDPVASSLDWAPLTGIFLLVLSLACDGLAGVLEDKYIAEFNLGPFDLMLRISALSWVGCGVLLGRDWLILWHLPLATWHLIGVIGVCGGLGQVFLFVSIAAFGSLSTSVVGTCRKMLTMLTSIYVFQHPVAPAQVVGLGCAFMGMVMSTGFKPSSFAIDMNVVAWLYHHRKLHQTNHVV